MNVERIETEHGSYIEPALKDHWSRLKKLQWHAAVVLVDSGVRATVTPSDYSTRTLGVWIRNLGYYDINTGCGSSGPHTYEGAWGYLNGVRAGAMAAKK